MSAGTPQAPTELAKAIARWENEGGAPARVASDKETNWFIPALVMPGLLLACIAAGMAYRCYRR